MTVLDPVMLPTDSEPLASGRPRRQINFYRRFERVILLIHRWLGIAACLLMLMWLLSGVVITYVRFPTFTLQERLSSLPSVDWQQVRVTPATALAADKAGMFPRLLRLEVEGDEPVYRVTGWDRTESAVSAIDGNRIDPVSPDRALLIVRRQLLAPAATLRQPDLNLDQWTVQPALDPERPFSLIDLNDAQGTRVYVSRKTGEIVLRTTARQRFWNMFGAVPHWLYFKFLRHDTSDWEWAVDILSGACSFVAVSGLWIGIRRLHIRHRYANGKLSPFSGWMKWHHVLGLIGGLFLTLWIVSGLMTMHPAGLLDEPRPNQTMFQNLAGSTSPHFPLSSLGGLARRSAGARRVTFRYLGGRPLVVIEDGGQPARILDAMSGQPIRLTRSAIASAAKRLVPAGHLVKTLRLVQPDEYWHTGFYEKKLPVVRLIFDDPRATWLHVDPDTGELLDILDRTGRENRWSVVAIHNLDWYYLLKKRPLWDIVLFLTLIPGIFLTGTAFVIGWKRLCHRRIRLPAPPLKRGAGPAIAAPPFNPAGSWLVLFSSQSGNSERLARRVSDALDGSANTVETRDLADLDPSDINGVDNLLLVIATTGEGDPPDRAARFARVHLPHAVSLRPFHFSLLALGDRSYPHFCAFGLAVERWLIASNGIPFTDTILVDAVQEDAVHQWADRLASTIGVRPALDSDRAPFEQWRLVRREKLNNHSDAWGAFHLELEPPGRGCSWTPGDVIEIAVAEADPDAFGNRQLTREYSIASIPADGRVHLLVRQIHRPDGSLGAGSGWLTHRMRLEDTIMARIRPNPSFHPPEKGCPMILIGSGTGLAGLRSHLRHRVASKLSRNWLMFGERTMSHDALHRDEIEGYYRSGLIERLDFVFSRDAPARRYVQDCLIENADDVRRWIADGASLYVCGGLKTLAPGVDAALREVLGDLQVEELMQLGRYRRDVY